MNVQLAAHPHLYHLITWFEKEELLVQQLEMKVISDVSVHKRKRAQQQFLSMNHYNLCGLVINLE